MLSIALRLRQGIFDMMRLSISPDDVAHLRDQQFQHPHPRVQVKMVAVLLKAHNLPHGQIASILGICSNSVRNYLREYQQGGVEELKKTTFFKPETELHTFDDEIKSRFLECPPPTVKAAMAEIEKLTGIKRGQTQVRKYLRSIGMNRRKTGSIPAKANRALQDVFKVEKLEPRLEQARNGKRTVYFVDAAHFVFAPFLGYLWSFTRVFVRAPSGRKRFNVLGAVNAVTHELLTVTNDAYINGMTVCELLHLVVRQNIGVPTTLILDNARYQKCAIVFELATALNVELLYLPPYSPNFNLIERVWKFTKKHCLNSKYYTDFKGFSEVISEFLKDAHIQHKNELNSLLTHRFQDFGTLEIAFVT